jgi:hypothetical protein
MVVALGAKAAATIAAPMVTAQGNGGYIIGLAASSSTPTSTVSLFYDTSATEHTGKPIVQDLPLGTTSYAWHPDSIASGTYYIYAMVDDPLGAPAYAYSGAPMSISDTTPPDVPSSLRGFNQRGDATISWQPSTAADLAGYRVYFREPHNGQTFVTDIPSGQETSYLQQGLYINGDWAISISAYDINDNESARSTEVPLTVFLNSNLLPLVRR